MDQVIAQVRDAHGDVLRTLTDGVYDTVICEFPNSFLRETFVRALTSGVQWERVGEVGARLDVLRPYDRAGSW